MANQLNLSVDRSSPVPLYHQVVQGIEAAIHTGLLEPGSRLDNEIDLAAQLNLSRPTMRKAMDELVRSGLLVRKRGVGTQVVSSQVRRPLELSSLYDDLTNNGSKPTTDVLSFAHIEADDATREALHLPAGAKVYHFTRLRKVGGKPLALMENWVRDDITALDETLLGSHGLYGILRNGGVNFRLATQRIGAMVANDYQAPLLETTPGSALVTMERTAVDDTGRNVETGHHGNRAESYSFEMTIDQRMPPGRSAAHPNRKSTSMANWVYPLGSAADASWDISLGTADSPLEVDSWAHTGLKVATLAAGAAVELPAAAEERIIVPLSGSFTATVDGRAHQLAGRASVFSGPSDVLYTGTGKAVTVSSADGGRVAVATAPARNSYPTRLVTAAETPVELRGAGNCSRQVHNFGTPAALEADRFIVCEVITPAGNWSSYPPHKHDEEKDGETSLEEIYYFETRVAPGAPARPGAEDDAIGYQRVYASDERPIDVSAEVRTGDVVLVPYGWHGPAMAAPGYDMYYLNVMAGPGPVRDWLISDDPHHGWIRQTWEGQDVDPRLPFTA